MVIIPFSECPLRETKDITKGLREGRSDSATLPRGRSIVQICVPCVAMDEAMS
jgi:hypothetical protein